MNWDILKKDIRNYGFYVLVAVIGIFALREFTSKTAAASQTKKNVLGVYAKIEVMTLGSKVVTIDYVTQTKESSSALTTTPGRNRLAKCVFRYTGNIYEGETLSLRLKSGVPIFTTRDTTPQFLIRSGLSTKQTYKNPVTGEMATVSIQAVDRIPESTQPHKGFFYGIYHTIFG